MRQRLRLLMLLLVVLSLPLFGGSLPAAADLPAPLDSLVDEILPESSHDPVKIASGGQHTCAMTSGGNAYCWGSNGHGQLGNGTLTNSNSPVQVLAGAGLAPGSVADITAGDAHTCAITTDGDAYCWGSNDSSRLGDGTTTDRVTPVMVDSGAGLASGTVDSIAAGYRHTCATTTSGDAYCWGNNFYGQIGDGSTTDRATPVQVAAGAGLMAGTVAAIATGRYHSCAVATTGNGYCWGNNGFGQLGDGTTSNRTSPAGVAAGAGLLPGTVAQIASHNTHTCARSIGGDAYCWGDNSSSQLGDGTNTTRSAPVKVQPGAGLATGTVDSVATGSYHSCATTTANDAYCWGDNGFGQHGDGSMTDHSTAVKVSGGTGLAAGTVEQLSAGDFHTCAVASDGEAYCWGDNATGQLGDGTTTTRTAPAEAGPLLVHHCDDPSTRVDEVTYSDPAHTFEVDIHQKSDGVYTCVYAERNGDVLLDEVVHVPGDIVTIDEDAPPGDGPDSPCTERRQGGNSQHRAYAGTTPSDTYPVVVCAGLTSATAGNRHIRIVVG